MSVRGSSEESVFSDDPDAAEIITIKSLRFPAVQVQFRGSDTAYALRRTVKDFFKLTERPRLFNAVECVCDVHPDGRVAKMRHFPMWGGDVVYMLNGRELRTIMRTAR